ncbi:hypothetical protein [Baaleninema sp.]|uniref:hypothetical protein n=1 Tax=Baaleninema sp. TaxID=3101197 RepID=UPI003D001919
MRRNSLPRFRDGAIGLKWRRSTFTISENLSQKADMTSRVPRLTPPDQLATLSSAEKS